MKRKITRSSLEKLSKELPVLGEQEQYSLVGGGAGTEMDPYSMGEYSNMLESGAWTGGFVDVGYGYWDNVDSGSIQGDRSRGVAYVPKQKQYSYGEFERMAIIGEWNGGWVRMRDGKLSYLGSDAKDDDGLINVTGNDNIDRMYTEGYKIGYVSGASESLWDDAFVSGSGILNIWSSGSDLTGKSESELASWWSGYGKLKGVIDGRKKK